MIWMIKKYPDYCSFKYNETEWNLYADAYHRKLQVRSWRRSEWKRTMSDRSNKHKKKEKWEMLNRNQRKKTEYTEGNV